MVLSTAAVDDKIGAQGPLLDKGHIEIDNQDSSTLLFGRRPVKVKKQFRDTHAWSAYVRNPAFVSTCADGSIKTGEGLTIVDVE